MTRRCACWPGGDELQVIDTDVERDTGNAKKLYATGHCSRRPEGEGPAPAPDRGREVGRRSRHERAMKPHTYPQDLEARDAERGDVASSVERVTPRVHDLRVEAPKHRDRARESPAYRASVPDALVPPAEA